MKRNIAYILEEFLESRQDESRILLVEGARQVGKTYLVNDALKRIKQHDVISINLEKEKDARFEIDNTRNFEEFTQWLAFEQGFKDNSGYTIFIDEAQESQQIGSYVLSMKEDWKRTKIVLTGSSMNKLFDNNTRVPVGRIEYLTVWPFSFLEFLRYNQFNSQIDYIEQFQFQQEIPDSIHEKLLSLYDDYLLVGGMPKAVSAYYEKKDFEKELRFIIASQKEDFQRKEPQLKNSLFIEALKAVGNDVGLSFIKTHITTNDYDASRILDLLKQWYIVIEVAQKGSATNQTNYHPKEYLYDLGIMRLLRETSIPHISAIHTLNEKLRTPLGGVIENAILLNMLEGKGGFYEINGWKDSANKEVDFIYKDIKQTLPIEVKASLKISNRHAKNLCYYLAAHQLETGLLVSLDKPKRMKQQGFEIINVPAYLFSQRLFDLLG
jgi:uncharacterized protein